MEYPVPQNVEADEQGGELVGVSDMGGCPLSFPVLILRVRNGLAYSYAVHWLYYALTVFMARAVGPTTVWPIVQGFLDVE